jgi:GTPase KRas protein
VLSISFLFLLNHLLSEEYWSLHDQWICKAQGFIQIYSISNQHLFEHVKTVHLALLQSQQNRPPLFVVVGNKCDQTTEQQVPTVEGAALGEYSITLALLPVY